MPRTHVIKKSALPPDQVEAISIDDRAFLKRGPRIPRERVVGSEEAPPRETPPPARPHRDRGVLPSSEATLTSEPHAVPTFAADFPLPDAAPVDAPDEAPASDEADEEDEDPQAALREELAAEWQQRLDEAAAQARREGYEEGRAEGMQAGYAEAKLEFVQKLDAAVEQQAADIRALRTLWTTFIKDSEPALMQLAVEVAEALLDAPLPESIRGASDRAIAEAVEELIGAGTLTVSLHPVDFQRLRESGLIDQLNANHEQTLRWNPDPQQAEGDWAVSSPTALIRHAKDEVLASIRQRLGLSHSGVHDDPTAPDASAPS